MSASGRGSRNGSDRLLTLATTFLGPTLGHIHSQRQTRTPREYGPYAENLRHVLNEIEGHYISGYADGEDKPDKILQLVPGATEESSRPVSKIWL